MATQAAEIEVNSPVSVSVSVRPGRNGGTLRSGNPGGNNGPPPSAVRAICRESFYNRIPILEQIADDPKERSKERIQAITTLGRMGFGAQLSIEDIRDRLRQQVALIQELAGPELAPVLLERLAAVWR